MDYGGKPNQKTKSESESGTTEVPRSTAAANKLPRNDGNEGWSLSFIILTHTSLIYLYRTGDGELRQAYSESMWSMPV